MKNVELLCIEEISDNIDYNLKPKLWRIVHKHNDEAVNKIFTNTILSNVSSNYITILGTVLLQTEILIKNLNNK